MWPLASCATIDVHAPLTHYFPLTAPLLETKAAALAKHHSQYDAPPLEGVRWVGEQVASAVAGAGVAKAPQFAEGFQGWF